MNNVTVTLAEGELLLDGLLNSGVALEHDCGGTLACTSCCVIVREGFETLSEASADELDMLDWASRDEPGARLACQARIVSGAGGAVVISLPVDTLPERAAEASPVSVTARAAKYLAGQLAKNPGAVAVRLAVKRDGCSGFGYGVDLANAIDADDAVFESGGVRIAVDPLSLPYLQGATVDLVKEGLARRLRFENPNARQSCGCGESFGT